MEMRDERFLKILQNEKERCRRRDDEMGKRKKEQITVRATMIVKFNKLLFYPLFLRVWHESCLLVWTRIPSTKTEDGIFLRKKSVF